MIGRTPRVRSSRELHDTRHLPVEQRKTEFTDLGQMAHQLRVLPRRPRKPREPRGGGHVSGAVGRQQAGGFAAGRGEPSVSRVLSDGVAVPSGIRGGATGGRSSYPCLPLCHPPTSYCPARGDRLCSQLGRVTLPVLLTMYENKARSGPPRVLTTVGVRNK